MPTWMVVEDEPDIYDLLLAMFEIWGIEGVAFVDGSDAESWIGDVDQGRVRGDLPELAILDIRLPEVSGPELGARLRRSPVLGDIAIVLITAYRLTPDDEEEAVRLAGADLLMYKPLPAMAELRQTMDGVIEKHRKKAPEVTEKVPVAEAPPVPAATTAVPVPQAEARAAEAPSKAPAEVPASPDPKPSQPKPPQPSKG